MKASRILIAIIALFFILLGSYLFLKMKQRDSIEVNQKFIKTKVFEKDSEGRGYSDRAKKIMEEELKLFNNDPIMRKYMDQILRQERITVLAQNKEEYIKEYNKEKKMTNCLIDYSIANKTNLKFKNFLEERESLESSNMFDLQVAVSNEYAPYMSREELKRMDQYPTEAECKEFENEK